MKVRKLIGLDMQLPESKLPGFYAQIIKEIAERTSLFDHYKELLVFESEDPLPSAVQLLEHYHVTSERCELLLLPPHGVEPGALYEDYVFVTRDENPYADHGLVALFTLNAAKPEAESAPALLQLEEHLIGRITFEGHNTSYMIDNQWIELAERIAKAYHCDIIWQHME